MSNMFSCVCVRVCVRVCTFVFARMVLLYVFVSFVCVSPCVCVRFISVFVCLRICFFLYLRVCVNFSVYVLRHACVYVCFLCVFATLYLHVCSCRCNCARVFCSLICVGVFVGTCLLVCFSVFVCVSCIWVVLVCAYVCLRGDFTSMLARARLCACVDGACLYFRVFGYFYLYIYVACFCTLVCLFYLCV